MTSIVYRNSSRYFRRERSVDVRLNTPSAGVTVEDCGHTLNPAFFTGVEDGCMDPGVKIPEYIEFKINSAADQTDGAGNWYTLFEDSPYSKTINLPPNNTGLRYDFGIHMRQAPELWFPGGATVSVPVAIDDSGFCNVSETQYRPLVVDDYNFDHGSIAQPSFSVGDLLDGSYTAQTAWYKVVGSVRSGTTVSASVRCNVHTVGTGHSSPYPYNNRYMYEASQLGVSTLDHWGMLTCGAWEAGGGNTTVYEAAKPPYGDHVDVQPEFPTEDKPAAYFEDWKVTATFTWNGVSWDLTSQSVTGGTADFEVYMT